MKTTIPPSDRYQVAISGVPQGKIIKSQVNNNNNVRNENSGNNN